MKDFKFTLKKINVSDITPNPENPRGKNVRDNDEQFQYLKRSIKELGLIVPIIVYKITENGKEKFILLDGERRYWALRELGEMQVSAHLIEGKIKEEKDKNIMFHIHTTRVQWEAFQQCRAIEPFYERLKKEYEGDESKISKELARITNTHLRTINDRLNFLRWPMNLKKIVYEEKNDQYWTVVEIESGIIKPAEKNFPKYFKRVPKDEVRRLLFEKYLDRIEHAATEVRKAREIARTTKDKKEQHKFAFEILNRLVEEKEYTFDDAQGDFLAKFPNAEGKIQKSIKKLIRQTINLNNSLNEYNFSFLQLAPSKEKDELVAAISDLEKLIEELKRDYKDIFE